MSEPSSESVSQGEELRAQVATACQVLDHLGQGDLIWGHVSARDPEGRGIWMKCSKIGFEEAGPDDVILVSWDGEVLVGDRPRHSEFPIHSEAILARPDVGAVVHTHAQTAVAFAALGVPLRPVSHEAVAFTPPDVPRFTQTSDLIVTRELGRAVAQTLGESNACFLVNHGVVVTGPDVPTAVVYAHFLERACSTQLLAMSAGGWATWTTPEESLDKRERCYTPELVHAAWDYLVRRVDQKR